MSVRPAPLFHGRKYQATRYSVRPARWVGEGSDYRPELRHNRLRQHAGASGPLRIVVLFLPCDADFIAPIRVTTATGRRRSLILVNS